VTLTESIMVELRSKAPDFTLLGIDDKQHTFSELKGDKGTVVMFISNHCPYVMAVKEKLVELTNHFSKKGISFVAINSNDVENYPEDSFDKMKEYANKYNYGFSFLFDETQEVAKAYKAAATPDIFVYNTNGELVYRGRIVTPTKEEIDEHGWKEATRVTKLDVNSSQDLSGALNQLAKGELVTVEQLPSMGCNIKWKES